MSVLRKNNTNSRKILPTEVESIFLLNTQTREVFDIVVVNADVDSSVLDGEYIIIDGIKYEVFDESDVETLCDIDDS